MPVQSTTNLAWWFIFFVYSATAVMGAENCEQFVTSKLRYNYKTYRQEEHSILNTLGVIELLSLKT